MSLEDDIEVFKNLPIFSELDPEALRVLILSIDTQNLRTGDILFRKGDRSDGGYFVLNGSLAMVRDDDPDHELSVVREGGLIGEMALITQTECSATFRAREPSSVLKIQRSLFQRLLREYPGSAARLRTLIEKRLAGFTGELSAFIVPSKQD